MSELDPLLQVLVVDDSALVRQVLTTQLSRETDFCVTTAADPLIAMEKMKKIRPHVIILDLQMPRMDGLTFLRKLMVEDPIPVIVCSAAVGDGTELTVRALQEGAVDVIAKPNVGLRDFLQDSAVTLAERVRVVARAKLQRRQAEEGTTKPLESTDDSEPWPMSGPQKRLVAIGSSTGGPEALRSILAELPKDSPAIVIVQHMVEGFSNAFARSLATTSVVKVAEAQDRDVLVPGRVLVAPGNRHLRVVRGGNSGYLVELSEGPRVNSHRPSVNVLFRSVSENVGAEAVGVILTGMGNDGAEGLLQMRRAGATTLAQDEASCVVFGMPEQAIACGGASEVVSLSGMPQAILAAATRRMKRPSHLK